MHLDTLHSWRWLDILSVLVAETRNPSDEDEGAVGVNVSSNVEEHGTTGISVAPNDPTDVVKNIAPLLLRRKLDVDICGFGFNKEAVQ